jgi:putative flippase GtrA
MRCNSWPNEVITPPLAVSNEPATSTQVQFFRFAVVGAAGFVVDAAALYSAMHYAGANHYVGRAISYLLAATFTWALNRHYTFRIDGGNTGRLREWAKFLLGNAFGGLLNYTTYAALVASSIAVSAHPTLGVAVGSAAGLLVNFALSRRFVFTDGRSQRERTTRV